MTLEAEGPSADDGPIRRWRPREWYHKDVLAVAGLPLQLAVADWLPERAWPGLARSLAWWRAARQPAWRRREAAHIARYLGLADDDPLAAGAHAELLAWLRIAQWATLAARGRDGWRPRTRLVGGEHVAAALRDGRGAILWAAPFALASIAVKVALAEAGHPLVHLSRSTHGLARSVRGARLANRRFTAAEDRFLAERAVIGHDGSPTRAVRTLARRLGENRVVSIVALGVADRPLRLPFLGGTLCLGPGAPALAQRDGAQLLPTFAVAGAAGVVEVEVESPLPRPATRGEAGVAALAGAYASRLADRVRAHPGQFLWRIGVTPG